MNFTNNESGYQQKQSHMLIIILLIGWGLLITGLALNDTFITDPGETPLAILLSFLITLVMFSVSYKAIPGFKEYILQLDMRLLILLHSWRMLGMGFMMLYLFDQLPGLFAYMAGFGDALSAVLAVFLAYALFRNKQGVSKRWVLHWNTFGLLDFIIAVSLGMLSRTDALLEPENGINSDIMTAFPLVIIPGFIVQVLALSHLIIYLQIMNNHKHDKSVVLS